MRVLSEAYIAHNISGEKVDQLVSNIAINNVIAFTNDEISSGGRGSTKALYITISCKGYTLLRPLLDNRSFVNVILMATLTYLPINLSHMWKTYLVVCAFDGIVITVLFGEDPTVRLGSFIKSILKRSPHRSFLGCYRSPKLMFLN